MANVWMTRDEMIADSEILPASFSAKYLDSNDTYIDCTYTKNDVRQDRAGVSDTTCDMSWWQNGDGYANNRFIAQYLAQNITNLPSSASNRRITVNIPVYMRNVKYLDVCFCVWIDLGYARGASLASYNDVSALAYSRDGDSLNLYCIPTPGNDHPGTARLDIQGSPGFIPFRFLYDDEDNPVNIDFITLEFAGGYSESNQLNIWISQPCFNEDIEFSDEPTPDEGNWGEDSMSDGGDGTFSFDSQDHGDIDNASISLVRSDINMAFSNLATGIHAYQLDANAMEKIVAVLYSSDYLTRIDAGNYNPLACVLSYHLLPSQFRNFDTGTRDVRAGGYNFTDDPPSEYRVPAQKICLHTQEVKFTKKIIGKHFGAFPDFAPYTQAIMHLPYVGVIELDVNAFMYGEISVAYLCDCYTGNVAAYVTCKDHMNHVTQKYVGTGNCAYSLPIFSENQSAQTLGRTLVSTGTSVASTVAALNMGSPFLSNERMLKGRIARYGVGSALESGGSLAEMAILGIPKVPEIHGEFGGNVGLVADDTVWMEIIRPIWSNPSDYQKLNGIPSNTSTKLSSCLGFTQVTSIELEGCTATAEEVEELKSILESGIIIKSV